MLELILMMKSEVDNSRLRDVVDFEVNYIRRSLEHELSKKDELISQKNLEISRKDQEIELLKAKLQENGIK